MIWIDTQDAFDSAMERIGAQPIVAVDTEADSLHSYFDKVCLVQISIEGEDYVIDPLSGIDLSRFGQILGDPGITKIFHGGDYDLRILNRDFGFVLSAMVDTMICAQLLGYEAFGLAALLERHFSVKLNKAHQRADWAMRPLPPDMLNYASMDTRYLTALAQKLRDELTEKGRWEWAVEEFSRLEQVRYRDTAEDPEPWRKMKNLGGLERRSLAIIAGLHEWRDKLARAADRPAFKILGNDAIIDIAKATPGSYGELAQIKTLSRYHLDRHGRELAAITRRALDLRDEELPERSEPKPWIRDRELESRVERLKKVRDRIGKQLGIDPSLLAPRHVLTVIAGLLPTTVAELDQVPAMRNWQKQVLGEALLEMLHPPQSGKLF
jgi:ribonuclease D